MQFEHPVDQLDQLMFAVGSVLGKVCGDLSSRGLATNELKIQYKLEDQTTHQRVIQLPIPMRDQTVFSKLIMLDIDARPPQRCVIGLSIEAMPANHRVVRRGLFVPLSPEPDKLEITIARIEKLVGAKQAGAAEVLDTYRPDAIRIKHFNMFRSSGRDGEQRDGPGLMGFRIFRPSVPARVQSVKGRPVRVALARKGAALRIRSPVIDGRVVKVAGPWRSEGDWWSDESWSRDEWDVAIGDSAAPRVSEPAGGTNQSAFLYRIYQDLNSGEWFIEGAYD
jgi:protein ImuB